MRFPGKSARGHVGDVFAIGSNAFSLQPVALFGLAFKPGTDDMRDSPLVVLAERLLGKGFELTIFDRFVKISRLLGKNKEFIEREIPHVWSLFRPTVDAVLSHAETVVIGNGSAEFRGIEPRLREGQFVVDLVRAFGSRRSDGATYDGICW